MEEVLKNIEGQVDILRAHNDTVEAVYESIFKMIENIGNEDVSELKKRGAIAKNGKKINLVTHQGSTLIGTDGKRIIISNYECPPEAKENFNNMRTVAIMIDEHGEITDLEVAYGGEGIDFAKRPPFSDVIEVATQQAKSVIKEENANAVMEFIHRMKNKIKGKSTLMMDDGKMTESDIQQAFRNLKNEAKQLKWKRKNEDEQKRTEQREEFKDNIKINVKDKSNLDNVGEGQEERE